MKLSFVSAQSQNSVLFSPTQSYTVQSIPNTMKSADMSTALQNNTQQQKQQLKGTHNNYISFGKDQINSPTSLKGNEGSKQQNIYLKDQLFQSPNNDSYSNGAAAGREYLLKQSNVSIPKSPKQVTFSDDKTSSLQQGKSSSESLINPYNLREARLKNQKQQFYQQQQQNDKIRVEENILAAPCVNDSKAKSNLSLIPSQPQTLIQDDKASQNNSQQVLQNYFQNSRQQQGDGKTQNISSHYLANTKLGERSVIKEETEEDSDYKRSPEYNNFFAEQSDSKDHQDMLRGNCINQEYLEYKNQQQALFKLRTAEEEAERIERIKNVVVENKKISQIKNSIKNRLAELERKIEDVTKTDGEVHRQLDRIDNHMMLMQESASELDDCNSNNNSKLFARSISQNKELDSSKITPRISNNEDYQASQIQAKHTQINQQTLPFQKSIKSENSNPNPNLKNQSNFAQTHKNTFENSLNQNSNLEIGSDSMSTINKNKSLHQNAKLGLYSDDNLNEKIQRDNDNLNVVKGKEIHTDDQNNISELVRDFSHIADNKRVNDSLFQNQQQLQSFSITGDYKKQYELLSESIAPSQHLPHSVDNLTNIHQQTVPTHQYNFSFRDRNSALTETQRANKSNERKNLNNSDEFKNHYMSIKQKINDYEEKEQRNNSSSRLQSSSQERNTSYNSHKYIDDSKNGLPKGENNENEYIRNESLNRLQRREQIEQLSDYKKRNNYWQPNSSNRYDNMNDTGKRQSSNSETKRREQLLKTQSQSSYLVNRRGEREFESSSRNLSVDKSSSELKHMLNEDLNRSLNKHKQLNQIKDTIADELQKHKNKQQEIKYERALLNDILSSDRFDRSRRCQTQPNDLLLSGSGRIKISDITGINNSSANNRSEILNRSLQNNNSIGKLPKENNSNLISAIQDSRNKVNSYQKSQSAKQLTPQSNLLSSQQPTPSSSQRNIVQPGMTEEQAQQNITNISSNDRQLQPSSSRSALNLQNITDRLKVENRSQDNSQNLSAQLQNPQRFIKEGSDQSSIHSHQKDRSVLEKQNENILPKQGEKDQSFKTNSLYNTVRNQLQERTDLNTISNKQISEAIKEVQKPQTLENYSQSQIRNENNINSMNVNNHPQHNINNSDKSYVSNNDSSFNRPKSRLQIKTLADFQIDSRQDKKYLEKEQDVYKKKINDIKRDIDEKEAQVKLQKKITECINIYQNERKNESVYSTSRQRSPVQTQTNLFNSSLNPNHTSLLNTNNGLSGLNRTDLDLPSFADTQNNKMLNLSMSVSMASPNQRSASRSKKSVRFLNPQDEKELLNNIEKEKKSKYQDKIKTIISQKVHTWLNKPHYTPAQIVSVGKYSSQSDLNKKKLNNNNSSFSSKNNNNYSFGALNKK